MPPTRKHRLACWISASRNGTATCWPFSTAIGRKWQSSPPSWQARVTKPERFLEESRAEAYFGRLRRSQELSRQAEDAALGKGDQATAAAIEATAAFVEALFGDSARVRDRAAAALSLGGRPPVASVRAGDSVQPTVALALAGDSALATRVADSLVRGESNDESNPPLRASHL
jgi:hypothetical protein